MRRAVQILLGEKFPHLHISFHYAVVLRVNVSMQRGADLPQQEERLHRSRVLPYPSQHEIEVCYRTILDAGKALRNSYSKGPALKGVRGRQSSGRRRQPRPTSAGTRHRGGLETRIRHHESSRSEGTFLNDLDDDRRTDDESRGRVLVVALRNLYPSDQA